MNKIKKSLKKYNIKVIKMKRLMSNKKMIKKKEENPEKDEPN